MKKLLLVVLILTSVFCIAPSVYSQTLTATQIQAMVVSIQQQINLIMQEINQLLAQQQQTTATNLSAGCTSTTGYSPTTGQPCSSAANTAANTNTTPVCTAANWSSSISPTVCPSSGQQTETWTQSGTCSGGVTEPATQTVACNYQTPTCTSFTYSGWSACNSSGVQTQTITSALPAGCVGGNPILSQSCAPTCTPNWQIGAWSACTNGTQTRPIIDTKNCGEVTNAPLSSQACTATCTPNWQFGSWSACSFGNETRSATDYNNCGTSLSGLPLTQACTATCTPDWFCTAWSATGTRTCSDYNDCDILSGQPPTTGGTVTQPTVRQCADSDWTYTLYCPGTGTQLRLWNSSAFALNQCSGGVTHPATETINCSTVITALKMSPATINYDHAISQNDFNNYLKTGWMLGNPLPAFGLVDQNGMQVIASDLYFQYGGGIYSSGSNGITYTSSDNSIVQLYTYPTPIPFAKGINYIEPMFDPLGYGTATVTAKIGSITSSPLTFSIGGFPIVTSGGFSSVTLIPGLTAQLTAQPNPASLASSATWTSSNPAVATVSSSGLVTAVSVGTTYIAATVPGVNGSTMASRNFSVSVEPSAVITNINAQLVVGVNVQGTVTDPSGTPITGNFAWTSSNPAVATVSSSGLVSTVSLGTAIITASSGSTQVPMTLNVVTTPANANQNTSTYSIGNCPLDYNKYIQVNAQQTGLTSYDIGPLTLNAGQSCQIFGEFGPLETSASDANRGVVYSIISGNSNVAQVSPLGLITALSPGNATIGVNTTIYIGANTTYSPSTEVAITHIFTIELNVQ